jgi:hypothetical protein
MGYDVSLVDQRGRPMEMVRLAPQGSTFAPGDRSATFAITYNYTEHFRRVLGDRGLSRLHGLTAAESVPLLTQAVAALQGRPGTDYWEGSEANARWALVECLSMAVLCPTGVWEVS